MADANMEATVKEALEMFRPQLQADGGDMEYVGIGVLKSILMQKRCRVGLRYLFYDMKNHDNLHPIVDY